MEWIIVAVVLYIVFQAARKSTKKQTGGRASSSPKTARSRSAKSSGITLTVTTTSSLGRPRKDDVLSDFKLVDTLDQDIETPIAGRWIPLGDPVSIGGSLIKRGGFYLCDTNSLKGSRNEPSLVEINSQIVATDYSYEDPEISYYPRFSSLNARAKGAYITWLASSRDDPDTPITYVFLYFYGFERRFLVDHLNGERPLEKDELRTLFKELNRLKAVFSKNRSFKGYVSRLMDLMIVLEPDLFANVKQAYISGHNSLSLRYQVGLCALNNTPVGPALAYGWARYHPNYSVRAPARRCEDAFKSLFKIRYREQFGDGIKVKVNKRQLELHYRPASGALLGADLHLPQLNVPDPFELTGPQRKLEAVAEAITEELAPLSRYLGKEGHRPDDIEASLLLPKPLLERRLPPALAKISTVLKAHVETRDEMLPVASLWKLMGKSEPEKLNKGELELLSRTLDNLDIGFAPDPRVHHVKPDPKGKITLFPQDGAEKTALTPSLQEYATVVRLGTMVAAQNGAEGEEARALKTVIEENVHLSGADKKSLHAYLRWSLQAPINMTGVKKRIDSLDQEQRAVLSKLLIGVAMADGHASIDEIRQLERIYTTLGLDKTMVTRDIHEVSSYSAKQREQSSSPTTSVSPLAPADEPSATTTVAKALSGFILDEAVLALHESETRHAQSLLGDIFADDAGIPEEVDAEQSHEETQEALEYPEVEETALEGGELEGTEVFSGLDVPHQALAEDLISRISWPRSEVEALASARGLMTDGALEVLNEWAFDQFDAPLIEDQGDLIEIDQDTLDEIKAVREQD
ncbi:hypothetical protein GCM10011348_04780 [Marinobacterium nitratireducens]|uniref:Tellurite resistance protein TerB n=1 Tax=Marinobacterium nitratireducens TaxID=518897 RepID=A0A917Z898_9GAMM|nr:TerB N-terminal domain-containing protein [Marinobacterium nitratireducens]GGO76775.1 hypothetical protein GCM10011348_04780 [Marinobacterium nitratireducens]